MHVPRRHTLLSHHICLSLAFIVACLSICSIGCGKEEQPGSTASTGQPAPAVAPPVASKTADERPKIVCLGDSLTAGLGLVETQSYPYLLQQKINEDGFSYEVVNAGVSGDTSAGGLRRLDWALQENVSVLVVALGANDGLRGLSVAEMKENLGKIIETAQSRNIIVILAGMEAPPNYGAEYAAAFRQAYREVALRYKVLFIPFLLAKVAGVSSLNQADGIHPNVAGAAIVADNVWAVLKPVLDQISVS
jgi:acyl-CoA thioesterase-1